MKKKTNHQGREMAQRMAPLAGMIGGFTTLYAGAWLIGPAMTALAGIGLAVCLALRRPKPLGKPDKKGYRPTTRG